MNRNRNAMRNSRNGGGNMLLSSTLPSLLHSRDNDPVMLDYLESIDRELNELKKKREIIKNQQGYFQDQSESGYDRKRDFLYDAPRYYDQYYDAPEPSHSGYKTSRSFGSQNNDYIPLMSSRKRQNPWQDDNMSKRFSGYERNNMEKSFGTRMGSKQTSKYVKESTGYKKNYMQHKRSEPSVSSKRLMSMNSRGSASSVRTEFKSKNKYPNSKVASNRPINLDAYPVATRKALIGQTIQSDACSVATRKPLPVESENSSKPADNSIFLYVDGALTPKLRGRLELALGHISKLIKEQASENKEGITQTNEVHRLTKQIIRERIKSIMLGKYVGPYMEIVAAYREKYPPETDHILLKAAHERVKQNFKYRKTDTAEDFLNLNMKCILHNMLEEMFHKLEEIYNEKNKPLKDNDVEIIEEPTCDKIDLVTDEQDKKVNSKIPEECKNLTIPIEELNKAIQEKLPGLLLTFVPYLADIMQSDYKYESSICELILKTNGFKPNVKPKQSPAKSQANKLAGNNEKGVKTNTEPGKTSEMNSVKLSLHYVKVIGRPALPKRKSMQTFLDQFEPRVIKKHKRQHNLLFVGFVEKKNFDAVLEKDGTAIGNNIIEIKASESSGNKPDETVKTDVDNKSENPVLDTSFGTDLNNQIDDLLSSIRQGEEKNANNITDLTTEEKLVPEDQNEVTIIHGSDDEQNENDIIEIKDSNFEVQSQSTPDNTINESEEPTDIIVENTEEAGEITEILEEISEETKEISKETKDNSEETKDISEETKDNSEETKDISEEAKDISEETKDISEETKEITDKTDEITDENVGSTEKTMEIIEATEEITKKDPVGVETTSAIDTPEDINTVQAEETVTSDKKEEIISKENSENLIQAEVTDSINKPIVNKGDKKIEEVKENVRATPTRSSSRLANLPVSTIKTRRASKLVTNNE